MKVEFYQLAKLWKKFGFDNGKFGGEGKYIGFSYCSILSREYNNKKREKQTLN